MDRLNREGYLRDGLVFSFFWKRNGEPWASVGLRGGEASLGLFYRHTREGREPEDLDYRVSLEWTPCHYGGARPWFICPACGRRAGKLYSRRLFRCRKCLGLVYESQSENLSSRLYRRRDGIKRRLGGEPGLAVMFPEKPKGMHWKTYSRLYQEAQEAEYSALLAGARSLGIAV